MVPGVATDVMGRDSKRVYMRKFALNQKARSEGVLAMAGGETFGVYLFLKEMGAPNPAELLGGQSKLKLQHPRSSLV